MVKTTLAKSDRRQNPRVGGFPAVFITLNLAACDCGNGALCGYSRRGVVSGPTRAQASSVCVSTLFGHDRGLPTGAMTLASPGGGLNETQATRRSAMDIDDR